MKRSAVSDPAKHSKQDFQDKRVRVKEDIDDSAENFEPIGRRKGQIKDEYESDENVSVESDSDNEHFTARTKPSDEMDMFGEKKSKQFMTHDEIEGQEASAVINDGDFPIESFNLYEELEQGDFDTEGHYVTKKDEYRIYDSWLQGITKNDINRAKEQKEKQESNIKQVHVDFKKSRMELGELMLENETPVMALARLGKITKIDRNKKKQQTKDQNLIAEARKQIEKISNCCTVLLQQDPNIYDKNKNEL